MGNVALLMRELGHEVYGADMGIYPPMSEVLQEAGIEIWTGYDPVRLERLAPDRVVVGNAMSRGHPEIEWLLNTRHIPMVSMPTLLHELLLSRRRNIVVAGTHGKTTTTALTAGLLRASGINAGYLVGGAPRDLPGGALAGAGDAPFVIEGDEYDSAFFDKRGKFIHYQPHVLVLNNLEFDHGDIFRDLEDIKRSFSHLLRIVPGNGYVLYNGDDPNLRALLPVPWTRLVSVGTGKDCDLRIDGFEDGVEGSRFSLHWRQQPPLSIQWGQLGLFNARNAAMALLAAGLCLGRDGPLADGLAWLSTFKGVRRRQELLAENATCVAIEDFGHHPTAIRHTLEALRVRYPDCRLVACFEPRSNTGRTRVFQDAFTAALSLADQSLIGPVDRADQLDPSERLDTGAIAQALRQRNVDAHACADNAQVLEQLQQPDTSTGKRVVCFFSNGSFGGIARSFAASLE